MKFHATWSNVLVASLQNISPQRNQVTILVVIDLLNKYLVCYSHIRYPIKNKILGLERCLRSQEYVSFLQRAQVQFSAPVPSSLQQPGTLAPETLLAPQALGFKRTFPHTETRILILKMKFFFFLISTFVFWNSNSSLLVLCIMSFLQTQKALFLLFSESEPYEE